MFREDPMFRAFAATGFACLVGIAVWTSLPAQPAWSDDRPSRIVTTHPEAEVYVKQAAFIGSEAAQLASYSRTKECSPWDASAAEMEEILQQMIRRGWQPPMRAMALADFPMTGSQLEALDPNAPIPVAYPQNPTTTVDGPIGPPPAQEVEVAAPVAPAANASATAPEPAVTPQ